MADRLDDYKEFRLFCNLTDLHGWQYFNLRGKSRIYQCIWGLVIVTSIVLSSVILTYAFLEYFEDSVQTTYHASLGTSEELYFPTVTICNVNQIRKSFVAELGLSDYQFLQVRRLLYTGSHVNLTKEEVETVEEIARRKLVRKKGEYVTRLRKNISSWKTFAQLYDEDDNWSLISGNVSFANIMRFAAQDLGQETILWASYQGLERNPDHTTLFYPFYPTDFGRCSLVHPMIAFNPEHETSTFEELRRVYAEKTHRGVLFGRDNGLTLLIDAETYDYAFSPQSGEGIKLGVTPYRDIPIMALSNVDLGPGTESQVALIPTLTLTTDRARRTLPPEKRKCYFQEEFMFKNFLVKGHRYSLSNCLQEAMEVAAYAKCGCDFFMRARNDPQSNLHCVGIGLHCFNTVRKMWGTYRKAVDKNGRSGECFPACIDQTHITTGTSAAFPNFNNFVYDQRDFCSLYLKLNATCKHSYKLASLQRRYGDKFCGIILTHTKKFSACSLWSQADASRSDRYNVSDVDLELQEVMYKYARDNLVKVHIFFPEPVIKKVVRDIRISSVMFLANIGGILGLAMGASIITLFELLYHSGRMLTLCSWRFIPKFKNSMVPNYVST